MLRHTALFLYYHPVTDSQKLAQAKGLAYLSYGCPSVQSVDFGSDLLGGSSPLLETKPWKRTPLWKARQAGPPSNYDVALHLDFDDKEGLDAYNDDDVHHEVGDYNASIGRGEFTARVDWWYDGPPRTHRGWIRHTALYLWDEEVTDGQKDDVRSAFGALEADVPSVRSTVVGENVGPLTTDYNMIVDTHFEDLEGANAYFDHTAQQEAASLAAAATKHQWTARITHKMASG